MLSLIAHCILAASIASRQLCSPNIVDYKFIKLLLCTRMYSYARIHNVVRKIPLWKGRGKIFLTSLTDGLIVKDITSHQNINYQVYCKQLNMLVDDISIIVDCYSVNNFGRNRKQKFTVKNAEFWDMSYYFVLVLRYFPTRNEIYTGHA